MQTCSFCGARSSDVDALIAGPGVNICNRCIDVSIRAIETRDALEQNTLSNPDLSIESAEVLLSRTAASAALADKTQETLKTQISELRGLGVGWHAIGTAVGLSAQMAEKRFS